MAGAETEKGDQGGRGSVRLRWRRGATGLRRHFFTLPWSIDMEVKELSRLIRTLRRRREAEQDIARRALGAGEAWSSLDDPQPSANRGDRTAGMLGRFTGARGSGN